ncbi:glycosyltransferase family 2 protein [Gordonia sinesedis]
MTDATIDRVSVIVPARNEQSLIGRCLRSIRDAEHQLHQRNSTPIRTGITVVLDRCVDATGDIADDHGVRTVAIDAGTVGAARRAGATAALADRTTPADRHWLVTTDADSVVPADWLVEHLRLAERGAHLVTGLVMPDHRDLSAGQRHRWSTTTCRQPGHSHVYGANLGIRADTYWAIGQFPPVPTGEDQALVDAARAAGATIVATDRGTVLTSARRCGRAPDGFAAWLHSG